MTSASEITWHDSDFDPRGTDRLALVDLLDRVLAGGVVLAGEVTLSVADVELVTISLRALITSASTLLNQGTDTPRPGP